MLQYTDISQKFLKRTPVAQVVMSTHDKWGNIKLKAFSKAEETVNWLKR